MTSREPNLRHVERTARVEETNSEDSMGGLSLFESWASFDHPHELHFCTALHPTGLPTCAVKFNVSPLILIFFAFSGSLLPMGRYMLNRRRWWLLQHEVTKVHRLSRLHRSTRNCLHKARCNNLRDIRMIFPQPTGR